jgi:hypothetical protein
MFDGRGKMFYGRCKVTNPNIKRIAFILLLHKPNE